MIKGEKQAPDNRALYRKYRSKTLAEVVGQEHITDILTRALKQGKVAHAYLFTGPRGVGKTSVARILAHEINGLPYIEDTQNPDIIEIDAASNRRIDDIRDLRDKVQIAPAAAKYKVYIIDEVHMLTGESFNAFLKTLEEPPEHVVFILATTDAHKLPVTITSRTQRFAFRAIAPEAAQRHLRMIANQEGITIDDDALELVVMHGDGSFRDSISLLDQLSSVAEKGKPVTRALVEDLLGMAPGNQIAELLAAYEKGDRTVIIDSLAAFEQQGIAPIIVAGQLIRAVRDTIATNPKLIRLLDALTTVSSSPRPDIKLLTVLLESQASTPAKVATEAVAAPAELKPLADEAKRAKPSEKHVRAQTDSSRIAAEASAQAEGLNTDDSLRAEDVAKSPTKGSSAGTKESSAGEASSAEAAEGATRRSAVLKDNTNSVMDFDWQAYVAHMKESHMALATILAKCKAESDGSTLTIYTGTAFWKKKLDDIKYQPALHDGIAAMSYGDLTIETIPTTMLPKDSKAAAVAAIMGGGEEVEL